MFCLFAENSYKSVQIGHNLNLWFILEYLFKAWIYLGHERYIEHKYKIITNLHSTYLRR